MQQNFTSFLAFQYFDYEVIWWRLFQKRVVHIKLDSYIFITNNVMFKEIIHNMT